MAKIIIVEGADNMGKTYLAQALANRIGGNYWHMTAGGGLEQPGPMKKYMASATDNAEFNMRQGRHTVFDRHWMSEAVYANILRDGPVLDTHVMIDRLNALDVRYICCDRQHPLEAYLKNQDPDHPYDEKEYMAVVQEYRRYYSWLPEVVDFENILDFDMDIFVGKPRLFDAFLDGIANKWL